MDLEEGYRKLMIENILVSVPDYIQKVKCDTTISTPPFKCAVVTCNNRFTKYNPDLPIKFHNFPLWPQLSEKWKEKCGLPPICPTTSLSVCSVHFTLDDYIRNYKEEFNNPKFKRTLKMDAVPSKQVPDSAEVPEMSKELEIELNQAVNEIIAEHAKVKKEHEELQTQYFRLKYEESAINTRIKRKSSQFRRLATLIKNEKANKSSKASNNILPKVFSPAQMYKLMGRKKVFWSNDDLAMAFTLRHMGSKECYLYLKNVLNFPLPALSCVQKWAASID